MKKHLLFLAICLLCQIAGISQTLPEVDTPITSRNYFEICQQLDAYFADEYDADEDTECWDNSFVKYQRWKWWWRDRVQTDGAFPNLRAQWLDYQKHFVAAAQNRDGQPTWVNEGPSKNPNGGYWGMGRTKHV
ncbi:MAG: hypothetical protein H7246_20125, partial [Phycisphaerae bacterium]|nr:hypothetical protein [Saprospiraceae bacterium]